MAKTTSGATWTSRDLDILEVLALRVRILGLSQITKTWWPGTQFADKDARNRMKRLVSAGLVVVYTPAALPFIPLKAPLFEWEPGDPPPPVEELARALQNRWCANREAERAEPITAYIASPRTANLYATFGGKPPRIQEVTHDLHMAEVYLYYRKHRPQQAALWFGEDVYGKAGFREKDPDALLITPEGERIRAIEFGGHYDAQRVRDFHEYCAEEAMPYEIW